MIDFFSAKILFPFFRGFFWSGFAAQTSQIQPQTLFLLLLSFLLSEEKHPNSQSPGTDPRGPSLKPAIPAAIHLQLLLEIPLA